MNSLIILGRQTDLAIAELESLYGNDSVSETESNVATLNIETESIKFENLGGSIKLAKIYGEFEYGKNNLYKTIQNTAEEIASEMPEGKIILGLSFYNISIQSRDITKHGMLIKKTLKKSERSVRLIPNQKAFLNSASVFHNKLTSVHGLELIVAKIGNKFVIARTTNVQNIEAYRERDQERPFRDSKIGMLPPKLAQIIINLARGQQPISDSSTLLDPFCGSGVVLQEASLMGLNVMGTDLNPKMVDFSTNNLKWLKEKYPNIKSPLLVKVEDATIAKWSNFNFLAAETYLGQPFSYAPSRDVLEQEISNVNMLLKKFLKNLHEQIDENTGICIAVPAWNDRDKFISLPLIDQIEDMGYNFVNLKHISAKQLFYSREDQIVVRQLLVIKRK